jgi:predicted small lipoprotein YifL
VASLAGCGKIGFNFPAGDKLTSAGQVQSIIVQGHHLLIDVQHFIFFV